MPPAAGPSAVEWMATIARSPGADLVLTGNARTIQALRADLKQAPAVHAKQRVKAYWSPGKRGLD